MIKRILKYLLKFILAFIVFWVFYFFFTWLLTIIPANRDFKPTEDGVSLYLISNGVHTDLCFSLKESNLDWQQNIDFNLFKTPYDSIQYLSVGWGDKGFYLDTPTWADLTAKTAIKAAFFPSATAIHISALATEPVLGESTKVVKISRAQLMQIEKYLKEHLPMKDNKTILIDCCRYEGVDDNFFEAKGSYHMFRTCNCWSNEALKSAGIKTAIWAPFDKCILYHF